MKKITSPVFFLLALSSFLLQSCASSQEPHTAQSSSPASGLSDSTKLSLKQEALGAAQKEWELTPLWAKCGDSYYKADRWTHETVSESRGRSKRQITYNDVVSEYRDIALSAELEELKEADTSNGIACKGKIFVRWGARRRFGSAESNFKTSWGEWETNPSNVGELYCSLEKKGDIWKIEHPRLEKTGLSTLEQEGDSVVVKPLSPERQAQILGDDKKLECNKIPK